MSEEQSKNAGSGSSNAEFRSKGGYRRDTWSREDSGNNRRFYFKRGRGSHHRDRGGFRNSNYDRMPFKRISSDSQSNGKRKKLETGVRLKEQDVGITEFVGSHNGFVGVIKERYTDFHVNEITLDGEVVKLTNQDLPRKEEAEDPKDLKQFIPEVVWDQLQLLQEVDPLPIEIDVTDIDKDKRRIIHTIAKTISNVTSQTVDKDGKKMMIIYKEKRGGSSGYRMQRDTRVDWKKRGGDYCHFVLHKVNMDTMDALNQLAMNLRLKPNNFNYAGTKDRRAWTTQYVSVRKVEPGEILKSARAVRGAYVGNFKFAKDPLKLGMLSGNYFRIALRHVSGTDEEIEMAMTSLRDNGFINYYGLQRFGTIAAIPTYEIGKTLLQGKWQEAIQLILKPRDGEQDRDLAEAREIYEKTKDACKAHKKIKRSDKIEASLLEGICVSGNNNPQGALDSIPRNARLMYMHAYQSFIWNHVVSRRIKEFGTKPVVGDLVYQEKDEAENVECTFDESNETSVGNEENDSEKDAESRDNSEKSASKIILDKEENEKNVDTEKSQETVEDSEKPETTSIEDVTNATKSSLKIDEKNDDNGSNDDKEEGRSLPPVKILTEEDLPNYTLADVIMPQVGSKVTYPTYAKPWFDELLAKDGLNTDLTQRNKKYSLSGAYRKILQVPSSLSWKIVYYQEKHEDLIITDLNEMRKVGSLKNSPEGRCKALIVEMSLRSSTYATMALREILKCDTSPQAQAEQSVAHNAEENKTEVSKADEQNDKVQEEKVDAMDVTEEKVEETEAKNETEMIGVNDNENVQNTAGNSAEEGKKDETEAENAI
ncbi:hypothetical protein KM043_014697 [Ampulex compressa]|nr:hypothetical protein KM043_014697 [Ampulex compressa]